MRRGPVGPEHPHLHVASIPDRFGLNREHYDKLGKAYSEGAQAAFMHGSDNNCGDLVRFYFLAQACDMIEADQIRGDAVEVGVFRGNTAFLFADWARRNNRTCYLFDTFESLPAQDLVAIDQDKVKFQADFVDTTEELVRARVGADHVRIIKGYFPGSIIGELRPDAEFAIVHLDCDLYNPTRAGLELFYPRLVPGGFLIIHDYGSLYWDGVTRAVDTFMRDKAEHLIPVPDKSGTVAIRKL